MPRKIVMCLDGTMSVASARGPLGRGISRTSGLAFGTGLRTNLVEAYTYLMRHWRPGDSVYVFGFSRGAYTARALVGMLNKPGLMRPGSENLGNTSRTTPCPSPTSASGTP